MNDVERIREHVLEIAEQGTPRPAIAVGLDLLADGMSFEQVILSVLAPVQREVGALWAENLWSIADEHAATAVVDGVLGALSLEASGREPNRGMVIVACAEGEYHTMPARMGVELLRADGWDVRFLGGSLPADDLQRFAAQNKPRAVVVSCTVPLFLPGARRCFAAVNNLGLPVFAAGAAFGNNGYRALRLGAWGWLGPLSDLSTMLGQAAPKESLVRPPGPEAQLIDLNLDTLHSACLAVMVERMPVMATYSVAQLKSTRADVRYILAFLAAAIDTVDDDVFSEFISWLSGILTSRHVPPSVLDESLEIIGEVLEHAGMTHAARLCSSNRIDRRVLASKPGTSANPEPPQTRNS